MTRINSFAFGLTDEEYAFLYDVPELKRVFTNVTIPDSVTKIGDCAFRYCTELTSITIPDSVTKIGIRAFYNCSGLKSIKLSSNLTMIDYETFYGCISLESLDVPYGVTTLGPDAFTGRGGRAAKQLVVNLPDTVTTIYYGSPEPDKLTITFKGNTYTDFSNALYDAVKQNAIEREFGGKDFIINGNVLEKVNPTATKIELPDSVIDIADKAFDDCNRDIIVAFKGKNYNYANLNKLKEAVKGS